MGNTIPSNGKARIQIDYVERDVHGRLLCIHSVAGVGKKSQQQVDQFLFPLLDPYSHINLEQGSFVNIAFDRDFVVKRIKMTDGTIHCL